MIVVIPSDVRYIIFDENQVSHIYQPLRSGRIWHKVNF